MQKEQRMSIITAMMQNLIEIRKVTDIEIHEETVGFKLRGVRYVAEGTYPEIRVRHRDDYQWAPDIEQQINHVAPINRSGRELLKRPDPKSLQSFIQPKSIRRS